MTHAAASTVPAPATLGWRRWFPNALTGMRLLIAIAFFTLLAVWNYPARELVVSPRHPLIAYLVAAALFGLAAVTDAIDGPLARRWKVVSAFGRIMDPFADKVLVVGGFIMLAGPTFGTPIADGEGGLEMLHVSGVHTWMVVVILGRELLVTSIRAVAESQGHDFSATWSGKAKMILQACVIPLILLVLGFTRITPGTWGRWVIDIAVWLTVGVTILSGIPYLHRAMQIFGRQ
ncbi:MAG: CDP-alcohol phosphatidyltransferase family protein [Phycisphaerales bacterium]|nr:MAG: CDP-alcohol phosphatidyltransferase family protein [Phycisphaerales bacterium]